MDSLLGIQNGFAFSSADAGNAIKIVSLSTDKDIYHSNEEMGIVLSVYSPENISDVLIKVSGVKSKKGVYYVSYSSKQNLIAGENNIAFNKTLPSCPKCAGISQGTYVIDASVTYDDEVVTATHSIAITSKSDQIIAVDIGVEEAKRLIDSESDDFIVLDVRNTTEYCCEEEGEIKKREKEDQGVIFYIHRFLFYLHPYPILKSLPTAKIEKFLCCTLVIYLRK